MKRIIIVVIFLAFAFTAQAMPTTTTTKHAPTVLSPVTQSLPPQGLPPSLVALPGLPAQPKLNIIPMPSQHAGVWLWDKFMQFYNCKIGWNDPISWCFYPPMTPN